MSGQKQEPRSTGGHGKEQGRAAADARNNTQAHSSGRRGRQGPALSILGTGCCHSFLVWAQGQLSRGPLDLSGPVRSCGLQCERSASGHPKSPLLEHWSSLLIETTHTHTHTHTPARRVACRHTPTGTRMFMSCSVMTTRRTNCAQPRLTATSRSEGANGVKNGALFLCLCRPAHTQP